MDSLCAIESCDSRADISIDQQRVDAVAWDLRAGGDKLDPELTACRKRLMWQCIED